MGGRQGRGVGNYGKLLGPLAFDPDFHREGHATFSLAAEGFPIIIGISGRLKRAKPPEKFGQKKVGKLLISHRYNRVPLLPSGPGGVKQELVV